ncbi:MAG: hypothetical protein IKO25_06030 [Clostridia bacterium]|nr:hypothetical protein [Clostridia bacterium]
MGRKRRKLHEVSIHEDIRYRGPLSYQHFQMLGWLCIVLSVIPAMIQIGARMDEGLKNSTEDLQNVLAYVASLSLPFLLIANFSKILNNAEGFKKQLIRNGAAALGIFAVSAGMFSRYVVGAAGKLVSDPEDVLPVMTSMFRSANKNGFIAFNLFIDLFLCTLFMYFLNARPKRVLTGKKVIILRVLALLPLACEAASWIIKWKSARGSITLPFWAFPLLTVKPPITFAVFVILALHMKTREMRFRRHGRSHEEYLAFLQTRRNSLHFSIYLSVILVLAAVADFIILLVLMGRQAGSLDTLVNDMSERFMEFSQAAIAVGFGESVPLLFVAPVMLLFSYTRIPKNKMISTLIPVAGIVLIVLVVLEGIYQVLGYLPFERINLIETLEKVSTAAGTV